MGSTRTSHLVDIAWGIEMWEWLRNEFPCDEYYELYEAKDAFLDEQEIVGWYNSCALCEVTRSCDKCPLESCTCGHPYAEACRAWSSRDHEAFKVAADRIIGAHFELRNRISADD